MAAPREEDRSPLAGAASTLGGLVVFVCFLLVLSAMLSREGAP